MKVKKVSFEQVSAIRHPQYYRGERPCVAVADVPDEHWTRTERIGDGVESQYQGLIQLMRQGELIRDVHLYEGEQAEPAWTDVTPDTVHRRG